MATKSNAYERYLAAQLADPAARAEFERERREIEAVDVAVNALDALCDEHGVTKAELARQVLSAFPPLREDDDITPVSARPID